MRLSSQNNLSPTFRSLVFRSKSLGLTRRALPPNRGPPQPAPEPSEGQRDRLLDLLRTINKDLGSQPAPRADEGETSDSAAPGALRTEALQHAPPSYNESIPFWALRPPKRQLRQGGKPRRLWRFDTLIRRNRVQIIRLNRQPIDPRALRTGLAEDGKLVLPSQDSRIPGTLHEKLPEIPIVPRILRLSQLSNPDTLGISRLGQLSNQKYPFEPNARPLDCGYRWKCLELRRPKPVISGTFQLSQLRNPKYPPKLSARPLTKQDYKYRWKRLVLRRQNKRRIEAGRKPATRKPPTPAICHLPLAPTVKQPLRLTSRPLKARLYNFNRERLGIQRRNMATNVHTVLETSSEQLSSREALDLAHLEIKNSTIAQPSEVDTGEIQNYISPNEPWQIPTHRLPLSPLMDPRLIAARKRYRSPKPLPSEELSEYERRLTKCAYAQALATPIRMCSLTGVRLPNFFHIGFGLARHQETSAPWYLPLKLSGVALDSGDTDDEREDQEDIDLPRKSNTKYHRPIGAGSGVFITAQRSAMQHVCNMRPKEFTRLIPARWKANNIKANEVVWREDMDSFVLNLLRQKIINGLLQLCSRGGGFLVEKPTFATDRILGNQVGAVTWLGKPDSTQEMKAEEPIQSLEAQSQATRSPTSEIVSQSPLPQSEAIKPESEFEEGSAIEQSPPPYTMVRYRGRYIPVYNLRNLLGDEYCQQLRDHGRPFTQEIMVIKTKPKTVKMQEWLWQLLGYLAGNESGG